MLWEHFDVREHGHEVRIARPARDYVHLDVIRHARTGDAPHVPALTRVSCQAAVAATTARRESRRRRLPPK
jgi:hypothetical protein